MVLSDIAISTYTHSQILALLRYISTTEPILLINHAAQNRGTEAYIFQVPRVAKDTGKTEKEKPQTKKHKRGRAFMENMNEGSMPLLCLLISPQGWGTLRLYSFTTADHVMPLQDGRVGGRENGGP